MKRLIFWDFPRASWQYDVVVALILAFIFLTPRDIFKDQPRAISVVRVPVHDTADVFWIEVGLLTSHTEVEMRSQAQEIVSKRTGKKTGVTRVETIRDEEEAIQGYMAFTENK